ncbi:response regulator transcription factor [Actinomadura livida]|uniref:DNA-binding response OmpR family regulator n=1 Tax=Actinomadura livida TaxID=79909 RepID=A0A7W7MYZ1_9ACTN|nr:MULTISPECIES: response regulator transcription factor [Actinomadura]MBB4776303.1 DNA-binding response OmpR family regulator [Actinomadura catellatispora]GGU32324.1 DNA-binding response regulator [Actinomadura livida]
MNTDGGGLVLVAEHDPAVAELQRRYLAREGFDVEIEPDPARAPMAAGRSRPDVVVLDLSASALPADLYRRVAEAARPAPVIAVTGAALDPAIARALGEHRIDRPFGPRVLVGAVAEALRGGAPAGTPAPLRAGALALDPRGRTAVIGDRRVTLTGTEFDLLEFLMGNPGRVYTREQLLDAAWGPGAGAGSRTVDVHVAQLRAKLGEGNPIRTVRGVGYVLDA